MSAATFTETMTAKERTIAALTGKPYDRIPVNLLISDHAARVIGVTVGEYNNSAELLARGQIAAWRRYGMDMVNTGPGLVGIPEAIGSTIAVVPHASRLLGAGIVASGAYLVATL